MSVDQHTLKINKDGYEPHEVKINIEKNKTNQHNANLIKPGILTLSGIFKNVTIEMDGEKIYQMDDKQYSDRETKSFWINKGKHTLEVSKDGYQTFQKTFSIKSEENYLAL